MWSLWRVCVCVCLPPPAGSAVELRSRFLPPSVLSALHQRAGRVSVCRLPHLAGPNCSASVPDPPGAAERDVLSAHQADQPADATQLLPHTGQPGAYWRRNQSTSGKSGYICFKFPPFTSSSSCSAGSCCLCAWLCSSLNNISFGTSDSTCNATPTQGEKARWQKNISVSFESICLHLCLLFFHTGVRWGSTLCTVRGPWSERCRTESGRPSLHVWRSSPSCWGTPTTTHCHSASQFTSWTTPTR